MCTRQILVVWTALSGAVFPLSGQASELDEYENLKAALVRSDAKKDRKLPQWLAVKTFEPRPHEYLDDRPAYVPLVATPASIPLNSPDKKK